MASNNKLVVFNTGAGIGVVAGADSSKIVVGPVFPPTSSESMYGVACDWSENCYVCDSANSTIYQVTEGGRIRIVAGTPSGHGYVNGKGTAARFNHPHGIACDKSGNIYVADSQNNRLRKIDKDANVTTICGGFNNPQAVACGPNGEIYVADTDNHKVYRIEAHGRKLLLAGSTVGDVSGTVGGTKIKGSAAKFRNPAGISCDRTGNVYVSDTLNYKIKKIDPSGWVTLFAGSGAKANILGSSLTAAFVRPIFNTCTTSGEIYVIDRVGGQNRLKRINQNGTVATVGYIPGTEWMGTVGALGVATDPANRLYVVVSPGTDISTYSSSSSNSSSQSETESSPAVTESLADSSLSSVSSVSSESSSLSSTER